MLRPTSVLFGAFLAMITTAGLSFAAEPEGWSPLDDTSAIIAATKSFSQTSECSTGGGKDGIILGRQTDTSEGLVSDQWLQHNVRAPLWKEAAPLLDNLRERNKTSKTIILTEHSNSPQLLIRDLSGLNGPKTYELAKGVRCIVSSMLPGVSADGNAALVIFHVMPTPHGSLALCVLRKRGSTWEVVESQFFEFI